MLFAGHNLDGSADDDGASGTKARAHDLSRIEDNIPEQAQQPVVDPAEEVGHGGGLVGNDSGCCGGGREDG